MNAEPLNSLFRSEVEQARRRIEGEIVLAEPVRVYVLVSLIFGIVIAIGLWLALGTYTRTETARGILATKAASAKIIAIRPGQVTELLVSEGDVVRVGQRLATIRTEQTDEAGDSAIGESLTAIESQRLLAEQQVRLAGRRADSDRARLAATLAGLVQQRANLAGQIALQEEAVASARDLFERVSGLLESGFISRIEVERRRQGYILARQDLARLHQQHNSLGAESNRTSAELARVAADADSEVVVARSSAETLTQQRARLRGERAYTLAAPVSGRVAALQTATGRTAEPSVPLMEIVPEGSALSVQVYAPTRAIGFVRPGQEVRLLYDAFPYQRFGSFAGRVVSVSRTVIDPRQIAAPLGIEEPVYRIEVAPNAQTVSAFGDRLPLQPGMTLTANLILDRRSFLDWLLTPLNAVMRRGG
ncbi:HlyD family efflux transporter periplasmic adaptor subunit [Sphingosinicella sp. LHD-64]|uniref:HlyD family efflux transporter periplasmic adaptor subunit n=1 Tax=Sphingosinicella sp. LHD-64 TaxID=3072139 RepID=UPI00280FE5CC|nr:HlyD family efflux transporter periplasmic adaptor subunit [Sphingosinicella sp. LHD-64]MDQ8756913.1 HlyD family efflux transporter periplasmic adaptor subunit [Sphingosinicella sp. LHD-64]